MRCIVLLLLVGWFALSSCCTVTTPHTATVHRPPAPDSLYVIVIGDEKTTDCLQYYKGFLIDSLQTQGKVVDGMYDCCVDASVDLEKRLMNDVKQVLSVRNDRPFILSATIVKVIVGYGTAGERTIHLALLDTREKKIVWGADIKLKINWFISDGNYQKVARRFCERTLAELRAQGSI